MVASNYRLGSAVEKFAEAGRMAVMLEERLVT